jgi:hypothetical protein
MIVVSTIAIQTFMILYPPIAEHSRPLIAGLGLPLCWAIVQVETRSLCACGSRRPFWRRIAAAAVLSPSTLDVYTALAIVQGNRTSRDALDELMDHGSRCPL